MWTKEVTDMIIAGVGETLYMTLVSTLLGYAFGLPLGVLLKVSDKEGLKPNKLLYKILDVIANIFRSIPFLILLILLIPLTRFLVGKSYGTTATIVPLTIAAIPFIGRMVESSLNEVDPGVIEAARSMGASNLQIVFRVMLVEARTSLISGATIVTGTILGYSAMAGTVGGGGLGDIAVRYGYNCWQTDIMLVTVTERTREIGIRRAIGAERSSIVTQFLIEAAMLCGIGGIIGLSIGTVATRITGKLLVHMDIWPSVPITLGAFMLSVVLGILFGIYPAAKASKLQPVEALRAE